MSGMQSRSGTQLDGLQHLKQSINDILSTPIGTRLMRRDYGSELAELIDQPDNPSTRIRIYAAIAGALLRWEPRIRLSKIGLMPTSVQGQLSIELSGYMLDKPVDLTLPILLRN